MKNFAVLLDNANRLFVICTSPKMLVSNDFLTMLGKAGVSVIFGKKTDHLDQLVDEAKKAGIEVIGCASVRDVELAKATARAGGIVIAAGDPVAQWCASGNGIEPSAWQRCKDVIDAKGFGRLQELIGGS